MIRNYLRTTLRNLRRNKLFSIINVLGLSVGISTALVIYLIVQYDFSFDKFHKDGDSIYRIVTEMKFSGSTFPNSGVPQPISDAVRKNVTGIVESAAFITDLDCNVVIPGTKNIKRAVFRKQTSIIAADDHYFRLFPDYKWIAGSSSIALQQPFQIVLTNSRSHEYFPGLQPDQIIGRQIIYNDSVVCTVGGIVADFDRNTDFTFREFLSMATFTRTMTDQLNKDWGSVNSSYQYFIRLAPGTSPARIEQQLVSLRNKLSSDNKQDSTNVTRHYLQPLADIHFNATYDNFDQRLAHKPTLYGLLLVAIFLLALGCINFINLTTAQAGQRAKEIGIRKTMGSSRRQLIAQFLSESLLLTLIGAMLSLLLTPWLLHVFSDFIPPDLHLNLLRNPSVIIFLLVLILTVSLLSGFYPALVLSRFNPVLVLKNQAYAGTATTRKAMLRKTLTVSQFVIAQVFIMATLVVGRQISYSINKDLGFKKDAIVFFHTPYNVVNPKVKRALLLDQLRAMPGIARVSEGAEPVASGGGSSRSITYQDGKKKIDTDVQIKAGDSNYVKIYGIRFLAGRYILPGDSAKEMVINETYAHILGITDPEKALGININDHKVVGVMADFHQSSLHKKIKPLAMQSGHNPFSYFHIALQQPSAAAGTSAAPTNGAAWKTTIAGIEKAYRNVYPDETFSIRFFDETIAKFYTAEQRISRLLRWASGLTIFISCLGLLGLVVFSTRLRTKEIGVRKVLGASVTQLVSILSKDFVKLVCIAFLIAVPIAWWATHEWLQGFEYRTTVSWWLFGISGLAMLVVALLTLSLQTIHAAQANPVDSLRSE